MDVFLLVFPPIGRCQKGYSFEILKKDKIGRQNGKPLV